MSYVNLLPEDYIARRAQKRANLLCLVLFGLVMAGVLAAAVVSAQAHGQTRQVNQRVNESYREAGRLIEQLQELESTKQRMLKKAGTTARLLERVPRSYLLATVTNALPQGGSLTCFDLTSKPVHTFGRAAGPKTKFDKLSAKKRKVGSAVRLEVKLVITGLAATDVEVARFITEMARCPLMETVDLVYSEEKKIEEVLVREFQVEMRLKQDADVRDLASQDASGSTGLMASAAGGVE